MTDLYKTLGVNNSATQDDIKRAYRNLASKHHPDRGGNTAKFQEIQAAYATLSDSQKRAEYDNPAPQMFHGGMPHGFHHGGIPPGFEQFFNNFGGFDGGFVNRPPRQNKTVNLQVSVSLEDAFTGKEILANVTLPSGREQIINIKLPAGVHDGTVLRLAELGDDSIPNMPRGDVTLSVSVANNPYFIRQGNDLIKNVELSMWDAALGTTIMVTTIDNKVLEVNIHPGTQYGQILGIQNGGMPDFNNPSMRGRLLLNTTIKMPVFLSEEQRSLLEKSKPTL